MTEACLEIVQPGMMVTIQDLGRIGHQAQGVPVSGALDSINMRLANALVSNQEGQGTLEFRIIGPTIRVLAESVRVALAGTEASIEQLEPQKRLYPPCQSVLFKRGDVFRVGLTPDTAVAYLAVEGGFSVPDIYASQATYVAGGFGGFNGRLLQAGDQVPLTWKAASSGRERICSQPVILHQTDPIRVVLGPQDNYFSAEGIKTFLSESYCISADSNRMGARLEGPPVSHKKGADINSDGIVTGAIQVPGNGLPILLLADHQTTGGYPKIACVASADLPRLGRMKPGSSLSFAAVSLEEAEAARRDLETLYQRAIASIQPVLSEQEKLWQRLASETLIDGVHFDIM